MSVATGSSKAERLAEMAAIIDSHGDWWRFPSENPIRGFLGTGRLFIVGDQPSTSVWESWHPNRRAFYELLIRLAVADAHLTDLYKVRGRSGALKAGLPADFGAHLKIFRQELDILEPTRVVALGRHAHDLLAQHVPEVRSKLAWMWHFAHAVRYGRIAEWEVNARAAIGGTSALPPARNLVSATAGDAPGSLAGKLPGLERNRGQRSVIVGGDGVKEEGAGVVTTEKAVETLNGFPAGSPYREWTIRDDNQHHYHSQVQLAESPLLVKLRWRATAKDQVHEVGCFRLHLPALLTKRLVREEKSSRARGDVRVRFVCENGLVYLQVRDGEPRLLVGRTRGA